MAKSKQYFDDVNPRVSFPELEEKILQYWKENQTFEKSVEQRPSDKKWNFVDGPPFITGLPHYGSLLSSIPKDLFPRFWTMKGYRVRRVWGWDCHGLPAENKVENKLHIKNKRDIVEKIGVKKFIEECKLYVKDVSSEWEWYVDHVGRWVDFKNAYKTMDTSYMESVMWVFKEMYDKGYIYKGLRVSLYCPHCGTPISNFEVAMDPDNYQELTEPANTYKYKLVDEDVYLLAWSTTPWNKLATSALAVNPKLDYVQVKQGDEHYILAKNTLGILKENPKYTIEKEFKGNDLVGKSFEPHYTFYKIDPDKKAYIVIPGDFVTEEDGTGIVTIAAYGEDDLKAMQEHTIQITLHVDDEGIVSKDSPVGGGMNYLEVNPLVNKDLEERGLMYNEVPYTHTVPTCWRCHTRLFYAPQDAWYVDVQKLKPNLFKNNEHVNWFPEHFKDGRFKKSMEAAPDWCISRSRYWGSPVPVWECECGERFVPGSIAELEKESGKKISDLHKPEIDEVTVPCKKCGKDMHRVSEVLDSWIEAGSAPFAERHFPFDKKVKLEDFFPPNFIVEYTGQIRAWFYVLHVIATAMYDSNAFKNVVVTGVILGTDGRKMSKNYGNYPDPKELIQKYGGDALRLYLMGSPVMHGEDIRISEEDYRNEVKGFLLMLWNIYNFFISYANVDGWQPDNKEFTPTNVLDRWILSRMWGNIGNLTTKGLEKYDTPEAITQARIFIVRDLSGWYIRRIRDRIGVAAEDGKDKDDAYKTLSTVLTTYTKVLAPIVPFVAEEIYRNLTKEVSVHLTDWPEFEKHAPDNELEKEMQMGMEIVSLIHMHRKIAGIPVRIPLYEVHYVGPAKLIDEVMKVIASETNVGNIIHDKGEEVFAISPESVAKLVSEDNINRPAGDAREIVRKIQEERKKIGTELSDLVTVTLPEWPKEFEEEIKRKALVKELKKGEFKVEKHA